ncbi:L-2,4-diaminobutyric acid acetyltransferase [Oxalicibacterium flavum]|uniref:L-2,4-diaminobutyric acid acetyltransferase n=1 Tax=Oxalicibacterium flavum TaxID=179467 RepID=A0A8J2ULM0_9BURK|nr:diaminobutyrate acetyltransferase [Oxalicibacterium flavum]GGC11381.1 L-2,4-diaminobutyric acid acetyltransferase [Oxalicibacterium flavum]
MTARVLTPVSPRQIVLRMPARRDGAALHDLIAHCPPLDLNSRYAYLLLCDHHADTCVVAEVDGRIVGAITAYFPPTRPDTLFVWQVAVDPSMQGQRLASQMLDSLIERCIANRPGGQPLRAVEATISPSNIASRKLFTSFAVRHGVEIVAGLHFSAADFGNGEHEEEWLYRLGPWPVRA